MTCVSFVRRHPLLCSAGVLALLLIALGLLALPLRGVPAEASNAQTELTRATQALRTGDAEVAWEHVARGRTHVDEVTAVTDGVSGRVWSLVPVVGSGVRDARHLASAMDELTSALEVTEELYPQVSGEDSQLLAEGSVHLGVLEDALEGMDTIGRHLREAEEHLHAVKGTNSFVGDRTGQARDDALAKVEPAVATLDRLDPMLDQLPALLGGEGRRIYAIALMNPAEMKYSGGSMLTFSHVRLDAGEMRRGKVRDIFTAAPLFKTFTWEPVEGNVLAESVGGRRITHANIAPAWPVAGEETLRAWDTVTRMETDGLIAVDVQAMARLLRVTGPLEVPELGEVTADNLVQLTAGDYARFSVDEQERRKKLNKAIIPAFMERLFSGVDFVSTMQALDEAAKGRHLALYLRNPDEQDSVAALGFDGDLSPTDHDYLGFFTQNMVGSKADYFQAKTLRSDVRLRPDGSARVTLQASVLNQGPETMPSEVHAYTDPRLEATYAAFLPKGATVRRAVAVTPAGEEPMGLETQDWYGRPFLTHPVTLEAGQEATLRLTYDVPQAAVTTGDGLTYRLDVDPHPTVTPERVEVTVHWPQGFAVRDLPAGWERTPRGSARWKVAALPGSVSWGLTAEQ